MKPRFFGQLWVRLLAATLAPVLIAVVSVALLANYVTLGQFERFLQQDTLQRDQRLQQVLARVYVDQGGWQDPGSTVQHMGALIGERVVLADTSGKVVADSAGQLIGKQRQPRWKRPIPVLAHGRRVGTIFINPTLPGRAGSVKIEAFLAGVNRSLIIGSVVALLASLILTLLLSNRLRRQLAALISVTREIGHGQLALRVPAASQGDLGDLASAINHMAEGLQRELQTRQQMVADVAHELRNPLQNVSGYIEAIRDGVLPADERTLAVLSSETGLLRQLVDDLQDLSLADSGSLTLEPGPLKAQDQIGEILASMRPRAEELGISLINLAPLGLPLVEADERRLRQVIGNLISNALANTPSGGAVTISGREGGKVIELSVTDTGRGIAAEDRERVFERFVRVDPARSRATGGAGLGLSIARELVHAMHGEIGVRARPGQGAQFWITLPKAAGPAQVPVRPAAVEA